MANYQFIDDTGVIIADTSDILTEVENEFKTSYGQDLRVTADTPQGTLISGRAAARSEVVQNNAAVANQINPNEAGGIFLDAISALLGLERTAATKTRVPSVILGGRPQTPIPAGTRARTEAGDIFESANLVTLDDAGLATVDFTATVAGPVPCVLESLTDVVDSVLGWETVTNPLDAVLGQSVQSDNSLRAVRKLTLARQGRSSPEAQVSDLLDPNVTPGVKSLQYRENYTDTDATIDGIFLKKHSVWACVDGGTDVDVATTLLSNKTDGADWNGELTVPVLEPFSGQTYNVKFDRPTDVAILARVTVRRGTDLSNPLISVPAAVVAYAQGLIPDQPGFSTGNPVSPFEIGAGVNYYQPGMVVVRVEIAIATSSPVFSTDELAMALNQIGRIQLGSVSVTVVS